MLFSHCNNLEYRVFKFKKVTCFFKALAKYQQLGLSEYLCNTQKYKKTKIKKENKSLKSHMLQLKCMCVYTHTYIHVYNN